MKIGISTSVVQRGRTGIAQYLLALIREYLNAPPNDEFTLFILEEDLPLFEFARERMTLLPVSENFRPAVRNIAWHQTELPRLAKAHQLDLLHIPSYRRLLGWKPCPVVATIHDLAPFRVRRKYDLLRMFYGRVIVRWLAHRQDQIIAVSKNTANDIERFFKIPRWEVEVIYNGLDHTRFNPFNREQAKAEMAARHQLTNPFFLYVARLEHPGKNHVRLIEAFERFKARTGSNWQLVFGGADWHGAEYIHQAIQRSPCKQDIKNLGFVTDEQLPQLYRAADIFVYPSLYEGFGMPPIEAMACGTPVISSDQGALCEVVDNAACIVQPTDLESISAALTQLGMQPSLRAHFQDAGLRRAAAFNWKRTAEETLRVYTRSAKNKAPAGKLVSPSTVTQPGMS
ncbi:MAG: glycosyltransferase family 1 protein [Verrucomicrobiota bacterium]|nr:glycosyltransferase family 1 protein [Verrucomicrobiota bacterium]